jgi:hypothetical protein
MRKMREDSLWNKLTLEQRQLLEHWLFEDNLGYAETQARVKSEFGVEATIWSVGRYYRWRARWRQTEELVIANGEAVELNRLPVGIANLREAAVKLAGKTAIKLAGEKPHETGQLVAFTRLLLESEGNELRRAKLKLAQQQFDYATAGDLIEDLPKIRSYLMRLGDDESLDETEKMRRFHAIMFTQQDPREIVKGNYTSPSRTGEYEQPAAGNASPPNEK